MGLLPEFTATVLKQSPYRIILILSFRVVGQKARHETSRCLQVEASAAGCYISTPRHSASNLQCVAFFSESRCRCRWCNRCSRCSHSWCCGRPCRGSQWCCRMRRQRSHGLDRCISCLLRWNQGAWCQWRPWWSTWSSPWRSHRNGYMQPPFKAPEDILPIPRWASHAQSHRWCPRTWSPQSGRSCLWLMAKCPRTKAWRGCTQLTSRNFGSRASSSFVKLFSCSSPFCPQSLYSKRFSNDWL